MARYFFDLYDGHLRRDPHGVECAGPEEIAQEAMQALPDVAKGKIPENGQKQVYTLLVRNERNLTVYTATLTFAGIWLGEDTPAIGEPIG